MWSVSTPKLWPSRITDGQICCESVGIVRQVFVSHLTHIMRNRVAVKCAALFCERRGAGTQHATSYSDLRAKFQLGT